MRRARETGRPRGANVNAQLLRDLLRARVSLIRLEARLFRRDILPLLSSMADEIRRTIAAHDTGEPLGEWTAARLQSLLSQAEGLIVDAEADMAAALRQTLGDASSQQARVLFGTLRRTLPEPVFTATFGTLDPELTAQVAATPAEKIGGSWFSRWSGDIRADVRTAVSQSVLQGDDTRRAIARVAQAVGKRAGEVGAITHTTIQTAANQVYRRSYDANADILQGVQWVATLDNLTCPRCGPLDGKWWSYEPGAEGAEGPISEALQPPLHPYCFPAGVVVDGPRSVATTRRWFEGDLVIIRRTIGKDLPVTPNHPILTRSGWRPARLVQKGDELIDGAAADRALVSTSVCPKDRQIPSEIQDATRTASLTSFRMPVSRPDFHGDGFDSEVDVEVLDRLLSDEVDLRLMKQGRGRILRRGGLDRLVALSGLGSSASFFERMGSTQHRCMCGSNLSRSLFSTHSRPLQELGFSSPTWLDTELDEPPSNHTSIDAEVLGARILRETSDVQGSKVVEINSMPFHGYVHNLQTVDGWYTANDVVVSNCRCVLVPITKHWSDLGIQFEGELDAGARASMNGTVPATLTWEDWVETQREGVRRRFDPRHQLSRSRAIRRMMCAV